MADNGDNSSGVDWKILSFRVCMWIVVTTSVGGIVAKTLFARPIVTPTHYFLILIMVASLLATTGIDLIVYVALKIQKLKVGGVEVELAIARQQAESLKVEDVPNFEENVIGEEVPQDNPFPSRKLTASELYLYEKLSHRLYRLFDDLKDLNRLDRVSSENFRKLLLHVGKAAHSMQHYTKSLEILRRLRDFPGRELDFDELRLLGTAFLWAAEEEPDKPKKRILRNNAVPLLKLATEKHPAMVVSAYNLGWAYLSLDKYRLGIRQMRRCMWLDRRYEPWLNWNIACGLIRLGKWQRALYVLRLTPAGGLWLEIQKDDWFTEVTQREFTEEFQRICNEKIDEYNRTKKEKESP